MEKHIVARPCRICKEVETPRGGACDSCWKLRQREYDVKYMAVRAERLRQDRKRDPERFKGYWNKKNAKIRAEMINAYGGRCECCGESIEVFLTLEHKKRDGAAHRRSLSKSRNPRMVYADLRKRGWPKDDYGILCFNCNMGSWKVGICPHKTQTNEQILSESTTSNITI